MAVNVSSQIRNLEKLKKSLGGIRDANEKALKNTVKDMKARAPGWISQEVTAVYNIKKSEVTPQSGSAKKPQRKAAGISVRGETVADMTITYTGNLLTPTHFGMTPRSRPKATRDENGRTKRKARPYSVSAEVKKGQRKVLAPDVFLGGNRGTGEIPFQRKGSARLPINAVKTVSVPQMITSERVAEAVVGRLNTGLEERFTHHIDRAMGR